MKIRHRKVRKIIIFGCGPHFLNRYLDVLLEYRNTIEVLLVVDLKCREMKILNALKEKGLNSRAYLFLDEKYRNYPTTKEINILLSKIPEIYQADAVIVSTEPKAHKAYALWATENGLNVFMDKPITAPYLPNDKSLMTDFTELLTASKKNNNRFVISCERRIQLGYKYVEGYLADFISSFRIPITSIHVHFGGGSWVIPSEMPNLENHPIKYGYGVLFHSGYHYLDLVARFAQYNKLVQEIDLCNPQVKTMVVRPNQLAETLPFSSYSHIIKEKNKNKNEIAYHLSNYGELDFLVIGKYTKGIQHRMSFSMELIDTTLSGRIMPNSFPGEGRIRQEVVNIHLGHFCSISIVSNSFRKLTDGSVIPEDFNITIATHPMFTRIGEQPVLRINRKDLSQLNPHLPLCAGLNIHARQEQLRDFLSGGNANSELATHENTVALLATVYEHVSKTDIIP
ncbi:Gfo/Idh/MocA family oxidoreductase [Xenorhabdus bovienii]|uniref:Gfo/Idh/MocA family oxidoreductase n=3 Tax=Xenorhabdus bovienii TaxID=40576 RepID=UPI0023B2E4C2|nr:Gfo/Idh/MocA family oxidoreductase [Xenorhabdus bovienii]MDE9459553.1 Gfo/Idh/MocA family oxidoreductase [Xenorhabdus bovienii]MDE9487898.1 Gfo/Idh/MocA family oxidoreductase [Xenorhabdus bovienii]MDE9515833.1 Gfo/Idh/MocA family oxidoreductase [Xenorhabdus bovienii]MDE9541027.1 Gfo/Idh/MocA family oxidoreductase [Xenorhabdus bovienii]